MKQETIWPNNQWPIASLALAVKFERERRQLINQATIGPVRLAVSDRAIRRDMSIFILSNSLPAGQG